MAAKRLIETPHAHYREVSVPEQEPPEQFYFKATFVGIYHIRFRTGSFAVLDAVPIDTPIFDQKTREQVAKFAASFSIRDRYAKAEAFRKYLERQWHAANIGASYYDFPTVLQLQDERFSSVKQFIERGGVRRIRRDIRG